jgi:hypothetical protein
MSVIILSFLSIWLWAVWRLHVGSNQRLELIEIVYWDDPELDWDKNMSESFRLSDLFDKVTFNKHILYSIFLLNPLELYDVEIIRKKARYDAAH